MNGSDFHGIRPVLIDSQGPAYSSDDINTYVANDINNGTYFTRRIKNMTPDYKAAAEVLGEAKQLFDRNQDAMLKSMNALQDNTKKASGNIRKAADDLMQGLAKVEKLANFDRLERYVDLLERAASAMSILADLEKSGKLDKIAGALK